MGYQRLPGLPSVLDERNSSLPKVIMSFDGHVISAPLRFSVMVVNLNLRSVFILLSSRLDAEEK